jgi:hypothetical protein
MKKKDLILLHSLLNQAYYSAPEESAEKNSYAITIGYIKLQLDAFGYDYRDDEGDVVADPITEW